MVGDQPTITTNFTEYQPMPTSVRYWWDDLGAAIWGFLGGIGEWLSNPFNLIIMAVVLLVVIIVGAFIFGKAIPFLMPRGRKNAVPFPKLWMIHR